MPTYYALNYAGLFDEGLLVFLLSVAIPTAFQVQILYLISCALTSHAIQHSI